MKKLVSLLTVLLALSSLAFAGGAKQDAAAGGSASGQAKYIFVFIGDGTSIPQRNAAELYLASKASPRDLENATNRAAGKFPAGSGVAVFCSPLDPRARISPLRRS
jgi:alkaline phosphatase